MMSIDFEELAARFYNIVIESRFNRFEYEHRIAQIMIGYMQLGLVRDLEISHRKYNNGFETHELTISSVPCTIDRRADFYVYKRHPWMYTSNGKSRIDMESWEHQIQWPNERGRFTTKNCCVIDPKKSFNPK